MSNDVATKVQVGIMAEKLDDLIVAVKDVKTTVYEVRDNQRDHAYELKDLGKRVGEIEPVVETLDDLRLVSKGAMVSAGAIGAFIMGIIVWCGKMLWTALQVVT